MKKIIVLILFLLVGCGEKKTDKSSFTNCSTTTNVVTTTNALTTSSAPTTSKTTNSLTTSSAPTTSKTTNALTTSSAPTTSKTTMISTKKTTVSKTTLVTTDQYQAYRNYFKDYSYEENEFSGLLKDKNVITIMVESGQMAAVNEYLTPNLYKLANEGINFKKNYSEDATSKSEFLGIVGNNAYSGLYLSNYALPFSIPNMLNGYKTSYFHDNIGSFYYREHFLPLTGFDNIYFHNDIYGEDAPMWDWSGNYTLDSSTLNAILPNFISTTEKFYSFWTTLSTHGPYDYNYDNKAKFNVLGYFDEIDQAEEENKWTNIAKGIKIGNCDFEAKWRYYQASMMNLDDAVGVLLDKLKEENLLDDTLIIVYGDHCAYYEGMNYALYGKKNEEYFKDEITEYYYTPMYDALMFMYNKELTTKYKEVYNTEKAEISEITSPALIVPTVLDLLGYKYNDNFYLGKSIFTNQFEKIFYSNNKKMFFAGDIIAYSKELELLYVKENNDEEDWLMLVQHFMEKLQMIDILYQKNIFSKTSFESFN